MSSQSNGSIFSARNTETNTSNDIKYESFGLPYIFNQPSMVITDNTSSINPTLSYLNNLNCWSNKAISNMEVTTLSSGIDFMPTSYFNEQEKLQKLQLQILQLEQKAKDNQNITKDYRSKENKLECFNGININPVDGNIPIQLWNNLRMIPDIFACNNPTLGENSSHHNSYRGLGVQDIPQLTFLNQMYSQMDMEHSDQSSHIPGNHSNVLTTEATRTYPYKTFPSVSLQNPSSIGLSSEQDQLLHYAKSQNTLLTEQLFNDLCTLQIESQRQQQANPFFRDNISELFRYSNLFQLNDTMHTGNQAFYSSSDSLGQVLPHNSISQSINNNNNTLITDANNNSSVNTLAYAQALMMVMNAVYGNYKTVETSDQSVSNFTSQSNGSNLMQIGSVNNSYQQAKSLNPEPKESFSEVLTFLSKCLNDPTNHNDKRQSQSYVKQSQQTSGPICTKPATLKLSGRQKTHDGNNQTNQSTSSTTHRGRGRPPKLVGTQYQTQSKQQSQSKQNSLMTSNDRQSKVGTQRMTSVTSINSTPNLDHNCSQLKTEYPSTYSKLKTDVYKSVTGESTELLPYLTFNEVKIKKDLESQEQKIFSPMNNRNGSSIEETIDEVLQSIADYKEDLVTLATQLAYSTLGISSNKEYQKENNWVHRSDSSLINIHTASEFTSSTPDTKGSSLTCTGQSRSRKSYSSERNPETVNKNVGQLGMLGETIYSNSLRQNLSTPKNSQDITETTSDFFSQPRQSESKYAKKCTLPVHSSLKTSIDPEVSNDYMRIKEEMKSSQSIDLTSSYPSKKRNNSSNITSHEFYTPKNSYLESNQMNIFPSNIYTSFQGSYSQNQQSSQVLSEQAYYDMFNNISQQGSVNLSHLNSTWSNFSHTVADTIQQQKFSEKEYLKNFFIEFVKQQEKVKREKDCLAMEERKQLRETKIQELIEQELRKPIEDLRLINLKPIPKFDSIPGNRMSGKMFGNCLMIIEFLHAFKDILNLDSETIPNLREFQSAFIDRDSECQQILIHLLIELLRLATEDPGIASSRLVTQLLGQKFSETEFNESNISGILRAFIIGRNGHEDDMSDWLKPPVQFIDLNGDQQAALLAFICDELICSSRLISIEVDKAIEQQLLLKREKWIIESRIRRLRLLIAQKSTIGTNSIISSMEYEREGKCDILSSEAYGIKDEDEITHLEKSYIPLKRYSKPITKFNTEGGQYSGNQKSYKRDTIVKSTCVIDTMMVQSNSVTVAGSSTCEEITSSPTLVKTVNSSVIPLNSCITSTDSFILSEDEDNMHKTYELEAKIKILNNAVEQKQREIDECSSKLSGIFLGQDRYYRNYYVLKHMGGIFIESEPCINIYSKDEYCSNRLRSKISENYITSIDSLSNSLPDSHPDYIVGVIEAYRTLAQQRHLKLTTSTINPHLYTQTSTIQSINKSEISIEKLQSVDKSSMNVLCETEQLNKNLKTIINNTEMMSYDNVGNKVDEEIDNINIYSESISSIDKSTIVHEKLIENSNELNSIINTEISSENKISQLRTSSFINDVNSVSVGFSYIPTTGTLSNEFEELVYDKKSSEVVSIKFSGETKVNEETLKMLNNDCKNNINLHSTTISLNEIDKSISLGCDNLLQKDEIIELNIQLNNDFVGKHDLSIEDNYVSSRNVSNCDKIDVDNSHEELECKLSESNQNNVNLDNTNFTNYNDSQLIVEDQSQEKLLSNNNTLSNPEITSEDACDSHINDLSFNKMINSIDDNKLSSSVQPLDLSNKSLYSRQYLNECINSKKCFNEFDPQLTNEINDTILTKSIVLFMNHTGIIPPIVNNQLYCNSWISIMNYCKMLLCSALSDELVYAKTLNSQNSTHFNRPLMEALLKLKTMIPDELINEVNEKDQSEYVENIDQLSGSSLTIDTDVSEHVNHELQLRRIQTIKEDLSWIRVKNESNKSTWYQITDTNKLGELLEVLTLRGVRERQLAKCIRRSKDFVELSMQVALKRNSEFDAAKCMSATRFNPQPFRIRSYRRRGRRSMRGHTRTNDVSLHNCTKSCNHKLLSEKGSRYFTTPSSWEASYSHDSKEIERPHSALSHSDLRYSDDCSSESNFGLTTTSSTYSKRNRMDIYNGYPYSPNKSLPDAVSVTNSKYRFVDDKKWQKDDTLTEEYVTFINECQLLCEVEALEDRVLCASLQIKGWTAPTKTLEDETIVLIPRTTVKQSPFEHWPIDLARSRLINIEHHLERRYLLPPLNSEVQLNVVSKGSTTELTLLPDNKCSIKECKDIGNETEGESDNMELDKCTTNPGVHDDNSQTSTHYQLPQIHRVINKQVDLNDEGENYTDCNSQILTTHLGESDLTSKAVTSETLPPGLINWRKNLYQASDVMTVRRSMEELIQAIAWDKSIMKVLCQICRRDNNEACLLLCDGCDRGYHTYCFRPQLSNIPSGDWFCYDCVSKATSKHLCYICGRCEIDDTIQQMNSQSPSDVKRMAICCHCSRAVHNSCARPTFIRIPKRWYCSNCIILKYSKLNHENCDLRLSKSRRKRKEYEDVADYSESNGNEKIKRRKICSVNNNTHTKTEDTSLEAYKTINKVDNTFLKQNQTRKYQGWWRKIHNYKKPNDTLDISNIPVNKSKVRRYKFKHHINFEEEKVLLSRKSGRKSNFCTNTLLKKPKRNYHRRSMLLVSKLSKCQDYHRRHSKRSLCKNTIHDEMNSCMNNSNEILSSNNQIIQHMNSDELEWCRRATEDLYNHESSWAFRKPVNHKQVPIYRKIIKHPIDLSTIRRKVQDAGAYSSFNNWVQDVRLMFSNCEVFNEDDSDVGRAGHIMRAYFECHWSKFNEGINANVHEKDEVMINNVNEEVITNYKNSSDIEECSGN